MTGIFRTTAARTLADRVMRRVDPLVGSPNTKHTKSLIIAISFEELERFYFEGFWLEDTHGPIFNLPDVALCISRVGAHSITVNFERRRVREYAMTSGVFGLKQDGGNGKA